MSEEEVIYPGIPEPGYRFVNDLGTGFTMGLAGSSTVSLFGSLRRGGGGLAGAARAISVRAPRAGCTLATYFALFSATETTLLLARRPNNEDLWGSVAAGVVSWAALGVRRGAPGAAIVAATLAMDFFDGRIPLLEKPQPQQRQPLHAPTTPADTGLLGMPLGPPIVAQEVSVVGDQRL